MTPEEEIARKKKFDAIKEDCRNKAHFKKAMRQYMNDSLYTLGLNIETLPAIFRFKEIFGTLPPLGPRFANCVAECRVAGASIYQGRLQLMGTVKIVA